MKKEDGWKTVSNDKYFADVRLNSSLLKDILSGPQYFLKKKQSPPETTSDAFIFGSALHATLLLDEELEKALMAVKTPAKQRDLRGCLESIEKTAFWKDLKQGRYGEVIKEQAGFNSLYKIKPDIRCPQTGLLVDLKTTSAPLERFQWAAKDFGYDLQAAHYLDVSNSISLEEEYKTFLLFVVEKSYPYRVRLFDFDSQTLEKGLEKRDQAASLWKKWEANLDFLLQDAKKEQEEIITLSF